MTRTDTIAHTAIFVASLAALTVGLFSQHPAPQAVPVVMLDKVTVTGQREVVSLPKVVVEARREVAVAMLPKVTVTAPRAPAALAQADADMTKTRS